MAKDFKQPYRFGLITALYITILFAGLIFLLEYTQGNTPSWGFIIIGLTLCYVISFFLIHYRTQIFIFRRVKEIYDNVTLLEDVTLRPENITTDMASLSEEVQRLSLIHI